jgi:hypothetical protein
LGCHCQSQEPNHRGEELAVEWQFSPASFTAQEAASIDLLRGMDGERGASGGRTLGFHPSRQRGNPGTGYCLKMKFHFFLSSRACIFISFCHFAVLLKIKYYVLQIRHEKRISMYAFQIVQKKQKECSKR